MPAVATRPRCRPVGAEAVARGVFRRQRRAGSARRSTRGCRRSRSSRPSTRARRWRPPSRSRDYMLRRPAPSNLTPFRFQADIMNGVDPSPRTSRCRRAFHRAQGEGVRLQPAGDGHADADVHRRSARARRSRDRRVRDDATPGFDYQSWMLAEVARAAGRGRDGTSTRKPVNHDRSVPTTAGRDPRRRRRQRRAVRSRGSARRRFRINPASSPG